MPFTSRQRWAYRGWILLVTVAALMNVATCGYLLFVVDWGDLYGTIKRGVALMDAFYGQLNNIVQLSTSLQHMQHVASHLNQSLFALRRQVQQYVPNFEEFNQVVARLNGTMDAVERSLSGLPQN